MRDNQPSWLLATALTSLSSLGGCTHHVYVTKKMTWECAPEHDMHAYPDAQTVRFKFVEAPEYEEEGCGKGLCDQLRASAKKTVMVEYETWGNSYRGLIGSR